jgi:prevent-host-death family protein
MDVGASTLRANLSSWLRRVRAGEEVVVTDRGIPVARLVGIDATAVLERLAAEGLIGRPDNASRPGARGRGRPRPRRAVSSRVTDQRR